MTTAQHPVDNRYPSARTSVRPCVTPGPRRHCGRGRGRRGSQSSPGTYPCPPARAGPPEVGGNAGGTCCSLPEVRE